MKMYAEIKDRMTRNSVSLLGCHLLFLLLHLAQLAGNFTADFLKIVEVLLQPESCDLLVVELSLQLGDISPAAHVANLRLGWLQL